MMSYPRHFSIILMTLAIASTTSGQLMAQNTLSKPRFAQIQTFTNSQKAKADELVEQADRLSQDIPTALKNLKQALEIYRQIGDRLSEVRTLEKIHRPYYLVGRYSDTLDSLNQARKIYQEMNDTSGEARILGLLGWSYYFVLVNKPKALESYNQSLVLYKKSGNLSGQSFIYSQLGWAYYGVGKYQESLDSYNQALALAHEAKDQGAEAYALVYISQPYTELGRQQEAIGSLTKALAIYKSLKLPSEEARVLRHLCGTYRDFDKNQLAADACEQATSLYITLGDYLEAGYVTRELGLFYYSIGEYSKALETLNQSLAFRRKVGERGEEARVLSDIGYVLQANSKTELAIAFYKEAVNLREEFRRGLRKLSVQEQKLYTEANASTYRALADLLLSQGRVLEAQQVLELLKIQELRNYTRDTRAGGETKGAPLNAIEAPVIPPFNNLIALGIKLTTCEGQKPYCTERDQLRNQRDQAATQFNQQADRLRTLARQGRDKDPAQLQQEELTVAAYKIVQSQPNTVLIYPLVLEDKLWLAYGLQAGKQGVVFASKEIPVSRKDLSATVTQFRQLLENPNSDIKQLQQISQKLYGWLIAPLRPQLDANGIQNLVFSLDRSTRYVPIAALYDGNQYLAQRFSLSIILTAGLTDTQDKLSPNLADNAVLGLGLSNAAAGFPALPNVVNELNAIVHTNKPDSQGIFQGTERLNDDFTLNAFKDILNYRILHMATHGKFDSEDPEKSFLVLGDGNHLKVTDIKKMNDLGGIHLVVLSACETAQGGPDKEGIEVSGLSYYFLTQNVKSVLASLWKVNDASTSQLMQQFYKHLATGKMSKAEALRQAQRSMIQGEGTATGRSRGDSFKLPSTDGSKPSISRDLRHPYYWAPFILIGNGL